MVLPVEAAAPDGGGRIEYLVRQLHGLQRTTVPTAWKKGRILCELRILAKHGDWGVLLRKWGVSPGQDWNCRRLAAAHETEEEAGRYRPGRALCAARPDADTCPR